MNSTRKAKLVKAIDKVADILEKCGGPGGTPGPCPVGGSGAGDDHKKKSLAAMPAGFSKTSKGGLWSSSGSIAGKKFRDSRKKFRELGYKGDLINRQGNLEIQKMTHPNGSSVEFRERGGGQLSGYSIELTL